MTQYSIKSAIIVGYLVVFEGMKAVSRSYTTGSQTVLKNSTPFNLMTLLVWVPYQPRLVVQNYYRRHWLFSAYFLLGAWFCTGFTALC